MNLQTSVAQETAGGIASLRARQRTVICDRCGWVAVGDVARIEDAGTVHETCRRCRELPVNLRLVGTTFGSQRTIDADDLHCALAAACYSITQALRALQTADATTRAAAGAGRHAAVLREKINELQASAGALHVEVR